MLGINFLYFLYSSTVSKDILSSQLPYSVWPSRESKSRSKGMMFSSPISLAKRLKKSSFKHFLKLLDFQSLEALSKIILSSSRSATHLYPPSVISRIVQVSPTNSNVSPTFNPDGILLAFEVAFKIAASFLNSLICSCNTFIVKLAITILL